MQISELSRPTTTDVMLYIVPTPIGNLADITLRALEVLKKVNLILAEDTRTSGKLLKHYGIENKLKAYHQYNEHEVTSELVSRLKSDESMALITDAGTPGISDPAFLLVRECIRNNIKVECLPGATAFVPALINSGLPADRFCFEGFIPVKKGRQSFLASLADEKRTMIFYESPYRLIKTLSDFKEVFGKDRQCSVSRELTKVYEENVRGTLEEVYTYFEKKSIKGELVIVVDGKRKQKDSEDTV